MTCRLGRVQIRRALPQPQFDLDLLRDTSVRSARGWAVLPGMCFVHHLLRPPRAKAIAKAIYPGQRVLSALLLSSSLMRLSSVCQ